MIDLENGLDTLTNRQTNLLDDIKKIKEHIINDNYENASTLAEKTLYNSEKNLVDLREVFYSININFPDTIQRYYETSAQLLKMKIDKMPLPYTVYRITIPFLLPNRRSNWTLYKESIGMSFYHLVDNYCKNNNVTPMRECVVCFVTYYEKKHYRYTSDNNNKEGDILLNVLSNHFTEDDNGLICDLFYSSRKTNVKTRTEIFVSNKNDFLRLATDILYNDDYECAFI